MRLITFIKPTLGRRDDGDRFVDEGRMEPLSLGVLAGLTPPGVDCRLLDDRIDVIDYDEPTDLVAINVETFTARRAYEIAAEYRARGVPVVLGGMHPTLLPDEVAEHADAVCTGDAETVWARDRQRRATRGACARAITDRPARRSRGRCPAVTCTPARATCR